MSDDDTTKLDLDVSEDKEEQQEEEDALVVKMSDDMIAVIRELVQLSLLTGTNIVDHLRAITCEVDADTSKLVPTEEYVEAYNDMIEDLVKKAEESQVELEASSEGDSSGISVDDLASGKFGIGVHYGEADKNDDPKDVN